jgi:hypothetical protein
MIKNITTVAVVAVLLVALSYLWTQKQNKDKELVLVNGKMYELLSREVEVVEVEKIVTQVKDGKTIYVEIPVQVSVPTEVDTMEVLKDYYSTRVYSDTLRVEDLGYVAVVDTISQNKIVHRTFQANLIQRTVTETITVKELPKLEIWSGFTATSDMQLGVAVAVVTKKRTHLGLNLGMHLDEDSISPYVGFQYLWQVR